MPKHDLDKDPFPIGQLIEATDPDQLGAKGPGYLHLQNAFAGNYPLLEAVVEDLQSESLNWQSITQGATYQYFSQVLTPDQASKPPLDSFQHYTEFVVSQVVEPLHRFFTNLKSQPPNEITAQRYIEELLAIDWHDDGDEFEGLIIIGNLIGHAVLGVIDARDCYERGVMMREGDLLVIRGSNFFEGETGLEPTEHAVLLTSADRVSLTLRSNAHPEVHPDDFTFDNAA